MEVNNNDGEMNVGMDKIPPKSASSGNYGEIKYLPIS